MAKSFYTTGTGNEQTLTPIINERVPIYDTVADAEADLANLEVGQIVKTKDAGLVANLNPIDEVKQGVFLPPTSNAVAKSLSYSTTEQKTGGVWIDGKPIYRKVLTATNKGTSDFTFDGSISDLDRVIKYEGAIKCTTGSLSGYQYELQRTGEEIRVNTSTGVVQLIGRNTSVNADYAHVAVSYTKTTD